MDQLDPAFLWWDEAIELARLRALIHRRRQRVRGAAGFWIVSHADQPAPVAIALEES